MANSIPSFVTTFKQLLKFVNSTYEVDTYSDKFLELKENNKRVEMAYQLLEDANLLFFSTSSEPKSVEKSILHREKGNKEFLKKNDLLAIETYSTSAAFAPTDSVELALAYANRSAVTYHLQEYSTCINDIDRALIGNYPKHLMYKLYERKGKCLLFLGLNRSAKEAFKSAKGYLTYSRQNEDKTKEMTALLDEYLGKCSEKDIPTDKKSKNCFPTLSGNKNKMILSASDLVQIAYSEEYGRHLVATDDIEPGDTLVIEEPFASVLLPTAYYSHCFHCKKRCHCLLPCFTCVVAMFCDEECRAACWDQSHRFECPLVPLLVAHGFSKIELIAVRTLIMALRQYKSVEEYLNAVSIIESENGKSPKEKGLDERGLYNSADYRTVHYLVGNGEHRSSPDLFIRATTAAFIIHLMIVYTEIFSSVTPESEHFHFDIGGLLLHHLMIVSSNAHEISEMKLCMGKKGSESVEIGGALYPVLSLTNHSCDPNVVRHSHQGDVNVLTAIKVIAAGEQILDNYGYHHALLDLTARQAQLCKQYFFVCKCDACTENWPVYKNLPSSKPVYINPRMKDELEKSSEMFQDVLRDIKAGSMEGKLGFLYAHLALMHRTVQRPWKEYSGCQEAIKHCLSKDANHYVISYKKKNEE